MQRGTLKLVAQNRVSEIQRISQAFDRFAEAHRVPPALRPRVELAFDELLNNIIAYAFEDEDEHAIDIELEIVEAAEREIVDRTLVVTISDDGIPFDPFDRPPPATGPSLEQREIGGLGIFLAQNMMDEVSYERCSDRNVVRLVVFVDRARSGGDTASP